MNTLKGVFKGEKGGKMNKLPEFEKMRNGDVYAFTYNPEDKDQYWHEPKWEMRIIKFHKYHDNLFKSIVGINYYLHLEISKAGRLHYHGIIRLMNKLQFYVNGITNLNETGQFEIDTINNMGIWMDYCKKQELYKEYYILQNISRDQYNQIWMEQQLELLAED